MNGILFDMDGVLIDAMPFHADAFQIAFKEIAQLDIDKKDIFLLEGMPGADLINEIFEKKFNKTPGEEMTKKLSQRKTELFKQNERSILFEGVKNLIHSLDEREDCLKAVVSGASKNEVKSLLDKAELLEGFDLIITGEDITEGKPDPEPFVVALEKLNLSASQALVVENSPIGVASSIRAQIPFIVTLNNTPLSLSDFSGLPDDKDLLSHIVFTDTRSATPFILDWCSNRPNQ